MEVVVSSNTNQEKMNKQIKTLQKRRSEIGSLARIEKDNALTKSGRQATGDVGDTDTGTDLSEQEVALILTGIETLELQKVDAALQRVREGRYGICEDCGTSIDPRRLALIPEAEFCTDCSPNPQSGESIEH